MDYGVHITKWQFGIVVNTLDSIIPKYFDVEPV